MMVEDTVDKEFPATRTLWDDTYTDTEKHKQQEDPHKKINLKKKQHRKTKTEVRKALNPSYWSFRVDLSETIAINSVIFVCYVYELMFWSKWSGTLS